MRPVLLAAFLAASLSTPAALPVSAQTTGAPAQTGSVSPQPGVPQAAPGPRAPSRKESTVCVTARGNCPIGFRVPLNTPCRCDIPGFGMKRGAAL